jgi:DNA-binding NarL/FixJ family response regulator
MIRLLLVDDQDIFRQGLATLLSIEEDLEVIAQANNGNSAIALTEKLQPDVILMDIQMPICDGVTATREICRRYPWMRILVLTTFDDDEYIGQSLQAGAKGYLLKRKPAEEMAMAIRAVNHGYAQLSPEIAPKVFAQIQPIDSANIRYIDILSSRELEVLQLVGHGKNNREISTTLHLSIGTVKNYISQILQKLEMRDRIAAALWAKENLR